jgi:hypothetical protein
MTSAAEAAIGQPSPAQRRDLVFNDTDVRQYRQNSRPDKVFFRASVSP